MNGKTSAPTNPTGDSEWHSLPLSFFRLYGGVTCGLMIVTLGSDYDGDAYKSFWWDKAGDSAAGMTLGFEAGANFYKGSFGLDLRYRLSACSEMTGDDFFEEDNGDNRRFGQHGISIGLGFMF